MNAPLEASDNARFRALVAQAATQTAPLFAKLVETASVQPVGSVAVTDGRSALTYRELVSLSSSFCEALRAAGLQRGDALGVALRNSKEFLASAFACWKLGAALVPVNPQLQEAELLHYIRDIGIRAFVTNEKEGRSVHSPQVTAQLEHLWLLPSTEEGWTYSQLARRNSSGLPARAGGRCEWPSTICYSTGSTGNPKRITRSQAHFVGEQQALSQRLGISPRDRILAIAPFFHGYSLMYSALVPLLSGGIVVTVPTFLPGEVAALIERERITAIAAVPFMFELLARLRRRPDCSSLRYVLSGGSPLTEETALAFRETYGIALRQAYGSTETGAISIAAEDGACNGSGSVGEPIPGVCIRILDDAGQPLPSGAEGHVHVDSPFAASGYDDDAVSSESRFVAGGCLPGDVGSLSPEGALTLTGRHRGFINVGGVKVDPTEVETVLSELPSLAEVVVFGVPDGAAGERVHAVLVTRDRVSTEEVRRHCSRRLSSFKQPRVIEFRHALPRSPLGKVLRQQLRDEAIAGRHSKDNS